MVISLVAMNGIIEDVRSRVTESEGSVIASDYPVDVTQCFCEIDIDMCGEKDVLRILSRWPVRIFLRESDRIAVAGHFETDGFRVLALRNLTDGSNYLFSGSWRLRRRLKRTLASDGDSAAKHWFDG